MAQTVIGFHCGHNAFSGKTCSDSEVSFFSLRNHKMQVGESLRTETVFDAKSLRVGRISES